MDVVSLNLNNTEFAAEMVLKKYEAVQELKQNCTIAQSEEGEKFMFCLDNIQLVDKAKQICMPVTLHLKVTE